MFLNNQIHILEHFFISLYIARSRKPTFEISEDEIEIGMGIHGEPGIILKSANDNDICKRILDDYEFKPDEITSYFASSEELYIISRRVIENFNKKK